MVSLNFQDNTLFKYLVRIGVFFTPIHISFLVKGFFRGIQTSHRSSRGFGMFRARDVNHPSNPKQQKSETLFSQSLRQRRTFPEFLLYTEPPNTKLYGTLTHIWLIFMAGLLQVIIYYTLSVWDIDPSLPPQKIICLHLSCTGLWTLLCVSLEHRLPKKG